MRAVAGADLGVVFAVGDVADVVEGLDAPVAADPGGDLGGCGLAGGQAGGPDEEIGPGREMLPSPASQPLSAHELFSVRLLGRELIVRPAPEPHVSDG